MLFIAAALGAFIVVLLRFEPKRRKPLPPDKAAQRAEAKAWTAVVAAVLLGVALSLSAYVGPVIHSSAATVSNVLTGFGTDASGRLPSVGLTEPTSPKAKKGAPGAAGGNR
jgi:hypothetical protein